MKSETEQYTHADSSTSIPNYLVAAVLSFLCCFPLAVVALIFSIQVAGRIEKGDIAGARRASNAARTWSFIAISLGLVFGLVSILLSLFFVSEQNNQGLLP